MMNALFDDYGSDNRIAFDLLTQDRIRIVKYLPENRLVCVDNLLWREVWNHPEDVLRNKPAIVMFERTLEKAREFLEEVTLDEIVAVGWDKYLIDDTTDGSCHSYEAQTDLNRKDYL